MNRLVKATEARSWTSLWRNKREQPVDDPADMGTAFGLDQSLKMIVPEPNLPTKTSTSPKTWMQRLHLRRKPAL